MENYKKLLFDNLKSLSNDLNESSYFFKEVINLECSKELNSNFTSVKNELDNVQMIQRAFKRMCLDKKTGIKRFRDFLTEGINSSMDEERSDNGLVLLNSMEFLENCILSKLLTNSYDFKGLETLTERYSVLEKTDFRINLLTDSVTLNLVDMTRTDNSLVLKNYIRAGFCNINVVKGDDTSNYEYVYKLEKSLKNLNIKTAYEFMDTSMDRSRSTDYYGCSRNTYTLILVESDKSESYKYSSIYDSISSKVTHRFMSRRTGTSNCGSIISIEGE